jgi:hypothetical protein
MLQHALLFWDDNRPTTREREYEYVYVDDLTGKP